MADFEINGEHHTIVDIFNHSITVPDCIVDRPNKIGSGNGEKKIYIATKDVMRGFFGNQGTPLKCFVLKSDLKEYLDKVRFEYENPSQPYRQAENFSTLWQTRMSNLELCDDVIEFDMYDQDKIAGPRGYLNTNLYENGHLKERGNSSGYRLITEIALPLISYIRIMKLTTESGSPLFYWKLFPDFDAIEDKQDALVHKYGKKAAASEGEEVVSETETEKQKELWQARKGQGMYRIQLLKECWYCPFTHIIEPELLIASHIKPWRDCNDVEKLDPKNGFAFTPMYDKLFDRGFITFSDDKRVHLSNWFPKRTYDIIGLVENQFIQDLQLDDERRVYLDYHRKHVFNG